MVLVYHSNQYDIVTDQYRLNYYVVTIANTYLITTKVTNDRFPTYQNDKLLIF